eukprot:c23398_g2_i1 orf=225-3134(+)
MATCASSSSSVCSNGSSRMNETSSSNQVKAGASVELSSFTPGGEGDRASIETASPAPSVFNFNLSNTLPHDLLYPSSPLQDGLSPMAPPHDEHSPAEYMKESVCVTVRFRPLSSREILKGDEVAWYADGDACVRSEYNPATAYAFDRVFGPATTTRSVYDVAAQNVVRGAMEGINGTVFAYGVTSSGKTYTMHGDPKSPGIIPLAVKDIFRIIQETPDREYLLRVSYLEIYNEVINDLLDPAGQNLRIREDAQGIYVEGIKEEVVSSPVHALSLIAAGEELRHVGSNNYNLLSSRSHTVFTLTVESSPRLMDPYDEVDEVTISQLNLIDLAGSESSKTETTGQRRKEGSYINKSLLTLGTVIGKLSEGRASHVPYRDSKLTRLLQYSLSGYGRVSLICTLTPASSNMEETHNTLKFAHRAKHVTIQAIANRIIDERSLIRKYQKEILSLKEELDLLKRGMYEQPNMLVTHKGDVISKYEDVNSAISPNGFFPPAESYRWTSPVGACLSLNGDKVFTRPQFLPALTQTKETMDGLMDALRGELKLQAGDIAECAVSLRRLSEQAVSNPDDLHLQVEMEKRKAMIQVKQEQMQVLEQQIIENIMAAMEKASPREMSEAISNLVCQLSRKECEIEIKAVDIKVLQDQLQAKVFEEQLQAKLLEVKNQQAAAPSGQGRRTDMFLENSIIQRTFDAPLPRASSKRNNILKISQFHGGGLSNSSASNGELKARGSEADISDSESYSSKGSSHIFSRCSGMQSQMLMQAAELESLKQEKVRLQEENEGLQIQSQKLAEEASYAKELASAAAVELRNLAQEVTKLSFQNSKLANNLSQAQKDVFLRRSGSLSAADGRFTHVNDSNNHRNGHTHRAIPAEAAFRDGDTDSDIDDIESWKLDPEDLKRELYARKERERCLEAALADKEQAEVDLRKKLEEGKMREADLENDLAGMWVQLAMLKKETGTTDSLDSEVSST